MQEPQTEPLGSIGVLSVRKSVPVDATPEKTWTTIGDFSAIATWHPAVESCRIEKRDGVTTRVLTLQGGAILIEQLVDWNDAGRSYTYKIVDGPLPVENYVSTLSVASDETGTRIDWQGTFDAKGVSQDEATGVISGVYDAGLDALVQASSS